MVLLNLKNYIFFSIIGIIFFSCSKEDLEADIPSYISIDDIVLVTDQGTHGSNSEDITDAWVFIDDNLVGVYELPVTFPILKEGNFKLEVFAGIRENGISNTRNRYLFYTSHEEQITLVKNKTLKISPEVTYIPEANFLWIEDFESAGLTFTYHSNSDTVINKTTTTVFEGVSSGNAFLSTSMDFFEAQSPLFAGTTIRGPSVFLEMDFKTNERFLVGIYADTEQIGVIELNTTDVWKKIYIDLTDVINFNRNASDFRIFFGLQSSFLVPFVSTNPNIFFDNIKIVHFQ